MSAEIRLGRYQDVLADVRCDTVIVDAPYSERTHKGAAQGQIPDGIDRQAITYPWWGEAEVEAFVSSWAPRTACWIASITDSVLEPLWLAAYERAGLYTFPRLGIVITGMGVRLVGDGPASWTLSLCVARRKARSLSTVPGVKSIWRALPGGYHGTQGVGPNGTGHEGGGGRGKPSWLLEALVRDYSDPGMTICDPCAGWGSTLIAARKLGRNAIGAEMDAEAWGIADRTLRGDEARPRPEQPSLFPTEAA